MRCRVAVVFCGFSHLASWYLSQGGGDLVDSSLLSRICSVITVPHHFVKNVQETEPTAPNVDRILHDWLTNTP